jgi:hypothetical protein
MISTIMKIQDASSKSIVDEEVLNSARDLVVEVCGNDPELFDRLTTLLFQYSATLASCVTVNTMKVFLTDEEMYQIQDEMVAFDELSRSILSEELPDENA